MYLLAIHVTSFENSLLISLCTDLIGWLLDFLRGFFLLYTLNINLLSIIHATIKERFSYTL